MDAVGEVQFAGQGGGGRGLGAVAGERQFGVQPAIGQVPQRPQGIGGVFFLTEAAQVKL